MESSVLYNYIIDPRDGLGGGTGITPYPPKKNYPYLGGAVGTPNDFGGGIYPP